LQKREALHAKRVEDKKGQLARLDHDIAVKVQQNAQVSGDIKCRLEQEGCP
jgi:hypothetical protein